MKPGRYQYSLLLLFLSLSMAGCGDDSASFSLLSDSDSFQQNDNKASSISKLDILWVIDNSGSMQTSQNNVAANFEAFISDMRSKQFDYQMAVTTTEAYRTHFTGNVAISRFRDGTDKTAHSGVFVIKPTTLNLEQVFLTNIIQGVDGNGDERAFHSIRKTFENASNAGFVRANSFLSVIIVSDEDDFSHTTSAINESYTNPNLHTVNSYVNYLDTFTNSTPDRRRYSVSAVAIFDEACRQTLNSVGSGRKIGVRYGQLVDATSGVKGSLCGNFADELAQISNSILELATQFFLSRIPIESTITIQVAGQSVPRADQSSNGGWRYESSSNSIVFSGAYIPPAGAEIRVDFDPLMYGG